MSSENGDKSLGEKALLHVELNEELKTAFMSYAMSTILSRALPDAV
jgi:DNA gyrase/topoisomerase IV subunit A